MFKSLNSVGFEILIFLFGGSSALIIVTFFDQLNYFQMSKTFDKEQIEVLRETFELYQIKSKEGENILKMKEFELAYNYLTGNSFSKDQLNEIKSEAGITKKN
jgi:hypothetical protein